MTATLSFTTKTLSQLLNDFSHLLMKYFCSEQESPNNHLMQHSHRWRVGKWVKINSSEHFPATNEDWHHHRLVKTCFFPLKSKHFLKRERLIYLFNFAHNTFLNGKAAWKTRIEQTLTDSRFWGTCMRIIWAVVHLLETEEQLEVGV